MGGTNLSAISFAAADLAARAILQTLAGIKASFGDWSYMGMENEVDEAKGAGTFWGYALLQQWEGFSRL